MPRRREPPRLVLDKQRNTWIIKDGPRRKRLGLAADQIEEANAILARYKSAREIEDGPAAPQPIKGIRTIYFITCDVPGFPIKIGMAGDVQARLQDARTMLPYP